MKIEKDKFVSINYTLKDENGIELDSSGKEPLDYIHGNGMLISGLEKELEGKEPRDKFHVVVKAKDAYGEYNENLIAELPKNQFGDADSIEIGMAFQALSEDGTPFIVHVVNITDETVTIDGNHELAGKDLSFDVEIVNVRDATEEDFTRNCSCGCGGNCGGCEGGCSSCKND